MGGQCPRDRCRGRGDAGEETEQVAAPDLNDCRTGGRDAHDTSPFVGTTPSPEALSCASVQRVASHAVEARAGGRERKSWKALHFGRVVRPYWEPRGQLGTGADPELAVDAGEVRLD